MEWGNVKITLKDFVAALVFTFTVSGFYYRQQYDTAENKRQIKELQDQLAVKKVLDEEKDRRIKVLEDDLIRRKAVEDATYNVEVPLHKKRS